MADIRLQFKVPQGRTINVYQEPSTFKFLKSVGPFNYDAYGIVTNIARTDLMTGDYQYIGENATGVPDYEKMLYIERLTGGPSVILVGGWIRKNDLIYVSNLKNVQGPVNPRDIKNINNTSPTTEKISGKTILQNKTDLRVEDDGILGSMNAAGFYYRDQIEWYSKFCRYGYLDPYNTIGNTKEFLFFTKPDLHIFNKRSTSALNPEIENVPIFVEAMSRYAPILRTLQLSVSENEGPFMNILSNSVKSNLDLPAITSNEIETGKNIYGISLRYPTTSELSDSSFDFSLDFHDTKFLEIYMLFKLYDEYERRKYHGTITPPDINYIYRKILHDQIAVYKFVVGEDGETLIYWAKLYGCYPKNAPRDAFSNMPTDGELTLSVNWQAQFVEDMDPQILVDFNTLVKPYLSKYSEVMPIYTWKNNITAVDGRWAGMPYIGSKSLKDTNIKSQEMQYKYMLKWKV